MSAKDILKISNEVVQKKVAPNISFIAVINNKIIYKNHVGKKQNLYDIASVTKMIFTTPMLIKAVGDKKLNLNDPVSKYLPVFKKHPIGKIKIKKLLNQTSGLVWWRPFYKRLNKFPPFERKYILVKEFFKEKPIGKNVVYSDLNFILLGWILENIYKMELKKIFSVYIAKPLKLKNTAFQLGKVNDLNCLAMGGVSTHAGLFSSLEDMTKIGLEFLNALKGKSKIGMKKSVLLHFIKNSTKGWGLGFMKASKPISTGGTKISTDSFGFPGFTGPSLWVDKRRNGFVVILAERNNPSRKNKKFAPYRVLIHDLLWEMMDA